MLDDAAGPGRASAHTKQWGGDAHVGSIGVVKLCGGSGMEEAEGAQQ